MFRNIYVLSENRKMVFGLIISDPTDLFVKNLIIRN